MHHPISKCRKELSLGNKTVNDIITVVEDICEMTWGPPGKECRFILENVQKIINWLENGITVNEVCQKLGLCPQHWLIELIQNIMDYFSFEFIKFS